MVSVPRVFEKIYAKVMDNVLAGSGLKRKIFFWGVKVGKEYGRRKLAGQPIGGWLRLQAEPGPQARLSPRSSKRRAAASGSSSRAARPLSKDIAEFFYALGLVILEGYGLTETVAGHRRQHLREPEVRDGRASPSPASRSRSPPDGEILTRGPNVMKGYYKKPAETAGGLRGRLVQDRRHRPSRRRRLSDRSPTGRRT